MLLCSHYPGKEEYNLQYLPMQKENKQLTVCLKRACRSTQFLFFILGLFLSVSLYYILECSVEAVILQYKC